MKNIRERMEQVEFDYTILIGLLTMVSMILIKALTDAETECYIVLYMMIFVPLLLCGGYTIIDAYFMHVLMDKTK